jgi:hypothetical protein
VTVRVLLDCGHEGTAPAGVTVGAWTSCWAMTYPEPGCQTQRRVVQVRAV